MFEAENDKGVILPNQIDWHYLGQPQNNFLS